jgi:hypothetical protein
MPEYFRRDFTRLDVALAENARLLGGLSRWSKQSPQISDRERALIEGEGVLTGEGSVLKSAGPGGQEPLSKGDLDDTPRPASEKGER